ncbi:MAG: hypothetical protein AB1831_04760 [Pseudomonadota bacterium]
MTELQSSSASEAYATEMAVLYRLMNAEVKTWPFPHFHVTDVFPPTLYQALIDQLPPDAAYTPIQEYGTVGADNNKDRLILSIGNDHPALPQVWRELGEWMLGPRFAKAMMSKFRPFITRQWGEALATKRLKKDARLVRDFTNYALPPHTDMREKVLAFLFYLPKDASHAHLGTSAYVPNDPDFRCPGGPHHPRENFTRIATAPYLPNSLFGFIRTDNAFHGVEPVSDPDVRRDLLLYNLFLVD